MPSQGVSAPCGSSEFASETIPQHIRIHFRRPTFAGAPKLVMTHGFAAGVGMYALALQSLTRHFEVFAFDMPGCGLSPRVPWTATSTAEAEQWYMRSVDAWFQEMPQEPVTLLGHSLGGYMTALWATQQPARVKHLVLASPVGVPHEPEWTEEQLKHRKSWLWWGLKNLWSSNATPQSVVRAAGPWGRDLTTAIVKRRFSFAALSQPLHVPSLSEYIYQISAAEGSGEWCLKYILKPGAWAFNPIGPRMLQAADAGQVPFPVTFLYGSHDWMSPDAGEAVASVLRGRHGRQASVHIVPQSGHQMFMENPEGFSATVIAEAHRKTPEIMGPSTAGAAPAGAAAPESPLPTAEAAQGEASELVPGHSAHLGTELAVGDADAQAEAAAAAATTVASGGLGGR